MSNDGKSKIIGVIHARGGSKRIPLKNIKPLNGRPLISYMIRAALDSRYLQRIIVSTDHPDIKRISLDYGAEVPFDRPTEISTDCPSELVTLHAVNFVEQQQGERIEIVVTMQPTTPFCLGKDIDACIELLLGNPKWNSVFSAKVIHERPEWIFLVDKNKGGKLFAGELIQGNRGVMQSLPDMVIPNGAVYATRRDELFNKNVIISSCTGIHIMPPERSVDIDEPLDLEFAEFLAKRMEERDE